ncbi:MAG: ISL3 family transposase [Cypionkella sp.]|uniref:ISL3 family transposase n=1 Tax=Cypionkella sp. TaxID=2811411 RepID=UPI002ABC0F09|nr:ISL3 family transposase [Cypionkella sp.]MDZ4309634.1 ISL3 family transposase [Cypionkella sp.]
MSRMHKTGVEAPEGLVVEAIEMSDGQITVVARSSSQSSCCPRCAAVSVSVHSRYVRTLADLPSHGSAVSLQLRTRRFRCRSIGCPVEIFAEQFDPAVAQRFGRRTERLEGIVHHIGLALGGRPGQRSAARLVLPVSRDTLLRVVRRRAPPTDGAPRVIGIDDWAWRKGHRYGTVVCDLEKRRIIDVLPDRETATVQAWLAARPSIEIIARDRGGGYGPAGLRGRPDAVQVADRWHLMENCSSAFLGVVRNSMRDIRRIVGTGRLDPKLMTAVERNQYEGWRRRSAENAIIMDMVMAKVPIKEIMRRTGRSRKCVRAIARGDQSEIFRPRASTLNGHLDWLSYEWDGGCRSGAELWRRLRARGYAGSLRVVAEWATRRRRDEAAELPRRCPSSRMIARLLMLGSERLSRADLMLVTLIEAELPNLRQVRDLVEHFHHMIRTGCSEDLDRWIEGATTLLAAFTRGIIADRAAVTAAITSPWSNGQTEGQITKLKLVKRQMYGRANLDLLRARLVGMA